MILSKQYKLEMKSLIKNIVIVLIPILLVCVFLFGTYRYINSPRPYEQIFDFQEGSNWREIKGYWGDYSGELTSFPHDEVFYRTLVSRQSWSEYSFSFDIKGPYYWGILFNYHR